MSFLVKIKWAFRNYELILLFNAGLFFCFNFLSDLQQLGLHLQFFVVGEVDDRLKRCESHLALIICKIQLLF